MPKGAVVPKYQTSIFEVDFSEGGTNREYKPDIVQQIGKKPSAKITDPFGEHIGGARKELWSKSGIGHGDIATMNSMERDRYIRKDNIWKKPDYTDMVKRGIAVEVVYAIKKIRDSLMPSLPNYRMDNTDELRFKRQEEYITFCSEIRDMAMGLTSEEDLYGIFSNFLIDGGYAERTNTGISPTQKSGVFLTQKLFRALNITRATVRRYQYDIKKTGFGTVKRKECRKPSSRKTAFVPEQLRNIKRNGLSDVRQGRDMSGHDFIDVFRIRGGEFGNWLTINDTQENLNMAYEAFHDFAVALGILPGQASFGGRLSIAFGARGKGKASAHYEPMREVINLTKMNGAGSLGHELFHALDDIIGKKLGLGGMMTEQWGKSDKIPYSVRKLFETMCYKDESNAEQEKRLEKECRERKKSLQAMIDRLMPDCMLTDIQAAKKAEIIRDIIKEAEGKSEDTLSYTRCNNAVQHLSELKKEVTGHSIPKKDIGVLQGLWNYYALAIDNSQKKKIRKVSSDYMRNSKRMDGIHSKDAFGYWSSLCEMFARAGACFLNDRLQKLGGRSDYLCGHSETCISLCDGADEKPEVIKAMPLGDERIAINSAMADMLMDLRERGLFMTDEERAGIVRDSARAYLENGCLLEVSYSGSPAMSDGCDACIEYNLYDADGTLMDGGEVDYSSEKFQGSDAAVMIPEAIGFCFSNKNMGYILMAGEENNM